MSTKQHLRKEIEIQRRALEPRWLATASSQIVGNFQRLNAFPTASTVALYKSIHGEVDLESLFSICWNAGKRTCIPLFNAQAKLYEMAEVTAETPYSIGHYGIREPRSASLLPMDQVDLIAVPGVAFDRAGNRLGRGGGYYDRLLNGFSGVAAAVTFDFQILTKVPAEMHDKPVDHLVTERTIVDVDNEH